MSVLAVAGMETVCEAIAGASGTWRILPAVACAHPSAEQVAAAVQRAGDEGARMLACEIPADHDDTARVLAAAGFALEAEVPDLVRDGTSVQLWVRRVA